MWILEWGALRSKSKRLAEQAILYPHPSKIKDFCHLPPGEGFIVIPFAKFSVLTIGGFFDALAELKEAVKTSNATPKCMWILEWGALCSKSKRLAEQAIFTLIRQKSKIFATFPQGKALS